jgi:hypothetical protein
MCGAYLSRSLVLMHPHIATVIAAQFVEERLDSAARARRFGRRRRRFARGERRAAPPSPVAGRLRIGEAGK